MGSILSVLGLGGQSASKAALYNPTDTIVPMHFFDDTPPNRDMALCWTLRFNDVLDGDKLYDALERLFNREGWRKLGGRLRLNVGSPPLSTISS